MGESISGKRTFDRSPNDIHFFTNIGGGASNHFCRFVMKGAGDAKKAYFSSLSAHRRSAAKRFPATCGKA
jgi:hypothetical protein